MCVDSGDTVSLDTCDMKCVGMDETLSFNSGDNMLDHYIKYVN